MTATLQLITEREHTPRPIPACSPVLSDRTYYELAELWTDRNREKYAYFTSEPDEDAVAHADGVAADWYEYWGDRQLSYVNPIRVQSSILMLLCELRLAGEAIPIDSHTIDEVECLARLLLLGGCK